MSLLSYRLSLSRLSLSLRKDRLSLPWNTPPFFSFSLLLFFFFLILRVSRLGHDPHRTKQLRSVVNMLSDPGSAANAASILAREAKAQGVLVADLMMQATSPAPSPSPAPASINLRYSVAWHILFRIACRSSMVDRSLRLEAFCFRILNRNERTEIR